MRQIFEKCDSQICLETLAVNSVSVTVVIIIIDTTTFWTQSCICLTLCYANIKRWNMWCCFHVASLMTKLRRLFRLHLTFGGEWYFSFISSHQRWHYLECDCEHVLYRLPFCMLNQMCTIVSADFWKDDTRTTIKYTICKYCCLFTDSVVMSGARMGVKSGTEGLLMLCEIVT